MPQYWSPCDGFYDVNETTTTSTTGSTDPTAYSELVQGILDMVEELQQAAADVRLDAELEAEVLEARASDLLDLIDGNV